MAKQQNAVPSTPSMEASFVELYQTITRRWRIVCGFPCAIGMLALIVTLLMPDIFVGTARVVPPQPSQSNAYALLSQLGGGGLASVAGGALGIKNPSDLHVGMLKGQTIADAVVARFDLQKVYEERTMVETREALERAVSINAGKDGIIVVRVEDEDPRRAAAMANAFVEELDRLSQTLAITDGGRRRLFFERQMADAKDKLVAAEIDLRKTQERSGLIRLDEQSRVVIQTNAELRAHIASREVQLNSLKVFATAQNPEVIRLQEELAELNLQLSKLERPTTKRKGDILVPTSKIPEAGLEFVRKYREVKYQEVLFELLAKQFELAKIDEANNSALIQVIDRATPADKKSKPYRALICLTATLFGLALGIAVAMVLERRESFSGRSTSV